MSPVIRKERQERHESQAALESSFVPHSPDGGLPGTGGGHLVHQSHCVLRRRAGGGGGVRPLHLADGLHAAADPPDFRQGHGPAGRRTAALPPRLPPPRGHRQRPAGGGLVLGAVPGADFRRRRHLRHQPGPCDQGAAGGPLHRQRPGGEVPGPVVPGLRRCPGRGPGAAGHPLFRGRHRAPGGSFPL